MGGTSGDEGELGGTGWGADSASSWDGAGSGAVNAAALGMPAARTNTSGASNTQAISSGQWGESTGVVAILAGDPGVADMTRAGPGLAGTTRTDFGLAGTMRADSGLAGTMRADSGLAGLL